MSIVGGRWDKKLAFKWASIDPKMMVVLEKWNQFLFKVNAFRENCSQDGAIRLRYNCIFNSVLIHVSLSVSNVHVQCKGMFSKRLQLLPFWHFEHLPYEYCPSIPFDPGEEYEVARRESLESASSQASFSSRTSPTRWILNNIGQH